MDVPVIVVHLLRAVKSARSGWKPNDENIIALHGRPGYHRYFFHTGRFCKAFLCPYTMAKDPAFLFYTSDFIVGTQFLSNEQVGKYIRLLCAQHQHGHLSESKMIIICGSYDKDIFDKFITDDDGLYYNNVLEERVKERQAYSKTRSDNRLKGLEKKKKTDHMIDMCLTHDHHMEDENENKDLIKKGVTIENPNSTLKKIDDCKEQCLKDELLYIEPTMRLTNLKREWLIKALDFFNLYLKASGIGLKNILDYRQHSVNWINTQDKSKFKPDTRTGTNLANYGL